MSKESSVAIIGSGVIGLTAAKELQEAGYNDITIYTDKHYTATTSHKAGAVFEPYHPGNMPTEEMLQFVEDGLVSYGKIIEHHPSSETGIRPHTLYGASTEMLNPDEIPYLPAIPDWELVKGIDAPGYYESAIKMLNIPFIDPTITLRFLVTDLYRNERTHIRQLRDKITNLQEFVDCTPEDIIVNASGLGARELNNDPEIQPMRGQIAVMRYETPSDSSVLGTDGYYIFPRTDSNELILGGTTELGKEEEVTDEETIDRIIGNAMLFLPKMKKSDLIRTYAGLRPFRTSGARVIEEEQPNPKKRLFSSVGFGGSGWTFAWGAAKKLTRLIKNGKNG